MVSLVAFVSFVPVVLASPPVRLHADGECPSAARIGAELEAIVSSREGAPDPVDVARIATRDGVLIVTLTGPDGTPLGERKLRAEGDCDAQARAIAVILATFLTDLHPEYLTFLPMPETDAAPDAQPADAQAPAEAPPPAPRPAPAIRARPPTALPAKVRDPPPVPTLAYPRVEWLLTAAAGVELSSELVPAVAVSLSFIPGGRGLGARAFALVGGSADRELGGAVASYSRYPFGVGPIFRVGRREVWFDAGAGMAVGWLHVGGRTFASNASADDVIVGPFVSLRAGTEWLGLTPFAELGGVAWPGESVLISRVPAASTTLPRFEANFLLGAGLPL